MDDKRIKIQPLQVAIVSIIVTLVTSISSDFGNVDIRYRHGDSPICGTFLIVAMLIIPAFVKEYRKEVWTKKSLIILFIALLINLPFDIICIKNHYNL